MATNDKQETLDRLLEELKSNEAARCLKALEELNTLHFSSPAIVKELEKLAIHHSNDKVRSHAIHSLGTSVHQYVRRQTNKLNQTDRLFLLKQIDGWEADGLLPSNLADVIAGRYDFDILPPVTASKSAAPVEQQPPPPSMTPELVVPTGPRLSLTQTLLSEASIKIYLYLGAFFVISSALILAALVEAARLPILAAATLAFGGTALVLRKRLPQPSFALFIVFSFLLPIDANVLEETIGLTEPSLSIYWTIIFLMMAFIWGVSVWFYESRFFSAVAFVALSLTFYRAGEILDTEAELQILLGMLASLAGLGGTFVLKKWKDNNFSLLVFGLAQIQVLGLLLLSFGLVIFHAFEAGIASGWWLVVVLTWLTAASFYALSDMLNRFILFPWMAVVSLLPIPWFLLKTFDPGEPIYAFGFWIWGAILALVSEAALRLAGERLKRYHWALLTGSVALFFTAFLIAFLWDEPALTLIVLTLIAVIYGILHLVRPRWYAWSGALFSALLAYFAFFALPAIERLEVPLIYQFLVVSILLVVPELFTRLPLSLHSQTRAPAIALGVVVSMLGITVALADLENTGRGALVLVAYAVLLTLHAFHGERAWLGYFAAACESLALVYALDHFHLDLWLPALTLLAALYYAAGFFFRRDEEMKAWGNVFIDSGLVLGALLSLTSLVLSKETSGWYILLIALFFAVETIARPLAWLELAVEALLSISLYQILDDFDTNRISHFLFGASLIWLGGDLIFHHLLQTKRVFRSIILTAGYILVGLSTFTLLGDSNPSTPTVYFFLYAAFFVLYAMLYREPRFGYLAAAFLALAVIKISELLDFEEWIFPLIALAVTYYAAGYWLRWAQKASGWDETLRYSGLALGVLTSLAALFQGGLDASIPIAIAATLFAVEAFALRSVWWALPADLLYLLSYFVILLELNVDEPQFYSIGAALLGMLMHFLLTRAGSKTGAFIAGMLSQLVLLGTTYIQIVSTEKLMFFFVLFVQSMLVLVYGLIQRSRSLVITPIAFAVVGVMTIVYSALKGLGPVILIGSTGVVLLIAGIIAVLIRERITKLGEQLSDWKP